MRKIDYIVVHCTGTTPDATIKGMKEHWKSLGWNKPGYHLVIRKDGDIKRLAKNEFVVNGVKGYNAHALHVAYIGGINKFGRAGCTLTNEQTVSLSLTLKQLSREFPNAQIVGHRDLSPDADGDGVIEECEWVKQCPCFNVQDFLKTHNITHHGKD